MSDLERIAAAAQLSPIDLRFADLIRRLTAGEDAGRVLELTAALVSRERGRGHPCVELERWAGASLAGPATAESQTDGPDDSSDDAVPTLPPLASWLRVLGASSLVGTGAAPTPLVLDDAGRCYLHRYWQAERRVAQRMLSYAGAPADGVDPGTLAPIFRRLFPPSADASDRQAVAAAAVVRNRVTVISGGPGTGKTSTVAKILALLASARGRLHVELAAPTGKAAARLTQSIRAQASELPVDAGARERIGALEARTIHRLLGYEPWAARFRHRAERPLVCDVLVVDEASMIDLLMMDALLAAAPPHARLVLVGDEGQLASVEAGFVFGDVCETAALAGPYSASFREHYRALSGRELVHEATETQRRTPRGAAGSKRTSRVAGAMRATGGGLRDNAVELQTGWRFRDKPGIERLAAAIRDCDADSALAVLADATLADACRRDLPRDTKSIVSESYDAIEAVVTARTPAEALDRLGCVRILCATNRGPWSVAAVNAVVGDELGERGHSTSERWYRGRPVLVTTNDYGLGLFNGDVGVCFPDDDGHMRAWFPAASGVRAVSPAKLAEHDTAWAMTVHKSQGSEFDRVVFVMPERDSPLLTRELLYTAVTRARSQVTVFASPEAVRRAVVRRAERVSGLRELLGAE